MKTLETNNYLQKVVANKLLGGYVANYARLFKTILLFKLDLKYDIRNILSKLVRRGDVVFDIGANIGQAACISSKLVGKNGIVLSFEPVGINFLFLKKMKKILRLKNLKTFNIAIGEKSGKGSIYIPVIKSTNIEVGTRASMKYKENEFKNAELRTEKVAVKTIDELMVDLNLDRLDVIKSDTEGNELDVLAGGINTINKYKPILILEIDYRNKGLEKWYNIGFLPYYINNEKLVNAKESKTSESNLVLIHEANLHQNETVIH